MAVDPRLTTPHADDVISLPELEIYHGLMAMRTANGIGLPEIPLSASLSTSANRHLVDAFEVIGNFTAHSWSDASLNQGWDTQILTGYPAPDWEIAMQTANLTPALAVFAWSAQHSLQHYDLVTEGGQYAMKDWLTVGVAMRTGGHLGVADGQGAAYAKFGDVTDPAGPPTIVGTTGNDAATLTAFADTAIAYEGNDTLSGVGGNDILYGNQGEDALFGDTGNDTLFGGQGADLVFGGDGSDALYGNMMNDVIYGATGDDSVFGGQGDDAIYGEAGNDLLAGNLGNDTLNGGTGADTFAFGGNSGADVVADFNAGEGDRLSLSGQTYTVGAAADGSVLLTLSGGGTVTLAGIAPATVNAGWIAG